MTRLQFFTIASVVIFVLERVLPTLVSWPIFIFPVFAVTFLLTSTKEADGIVAVAVASLFFDFFSGYTFGFATLSLLVVALSIFFFKTRFNVNPQSFFSLAAYCLIFVFFYFTLLSIKSDPQLIITQAPVTIAETIIVFLVFAFLLRKLKN